MPLLWSISRTNGQFCVIRFGARQIGSLRGSSRYSLQFRHPSLLPASAGEVSPPSLRALASGAVRALSVPSFPLLSRLCKHDLARGQGEERLLLEGSIGSLWLTCQRSFESRSASGGKDAATSMAGEKEPRAQRNEVL